MCKGNSSFNAEFSFLQKAGIAFKMDNHLPNLVNLNEDPQLSEVLLYMIKEGETTVGRYTPNSNHDIQLSGVLIADDHWYVVGFVWVVLDFFICCSHCKY